MSWYWWVLLCVALSFPISSFIGRIIAHSYEGDRYWEYGWDDPENITEITRRLRTPPPSKL